MNTCAATGCETTVIRDRLFCRTHYGRLPREIALGLTEWWNEVSHAPGPSERRAALGEYRRLRRAAIDYVATKERARG